MREKLLNFLVKLYLSLQNLTQWKKNLWGLVAFVSFAVTGYTLVWIHFERTKTISLVKQEIIRMENSLNEIGYDIAYDDLNFSVFNPFQAMSVKNLRFYPLHIGKKLEVRFPEITLGVGIFNNRKVYINFPAEQYVIWDKGTYPIKLPQSSCEVEFTPQSKLAQFILSAEKAEISHLAKIEKIQIASRRLLQQSIAPLPPFFENFIDIHNIEFSENFAHPLGNKISHIYLNSNIIGKIGSENSYRYELKNWQLLGGGLDIKDLTIDWQPLLLVGRGDASYDKSLKFNMHLKTSSKGLTETLDDLSQKNYLPNKGVFVAKILLSNKSFKMSQDDNALTVTSPIEVKQNQLFLENILLRDFNQTQE